MNLENVKYVQNLEFHERGFYCELFFNPKYGTSHNSHYFCSTSHSCRLCESMGLPSRLFFRCRFCGSDNLDSHSFQSHTISCYHSILEKRQSSSKLSKLPQPPLLPSSSPTISSENKKSRNKEISVRSGKKRKRTENTVKMEEREPLNPEEAEMNFRKKQKIDHLTFNDNNRNNKRTINRTTSAFLNYFRYITTIHDHNMDLSHVPHIQDFRTNQNHEILTHESFCFFCLHFISSSETKIGCSKCKKAFHLQCIQDRDTFDISDPQSFVCDQHFCSVNPKREEELRNALKKKKKRKYNKKEKKTSCDRVGQFKCATCEKSCCKKIYYMKGGREIRFVFNAMKKLYLCQDCSITHSQISGYVN